MAPLYDASLTLRQCCLLSLLAAMVTAFTAPNSLGILHSPKSLDGLHETTHCSLMGGYQTTLHFQQSVLSQTYHGDRSSPKDASRNVVLVTHMSLDRTGRAIELCQTWLGPISLSVLVRLPLHTVAEWFLAGGATAATSTHVDGVNSQQDRELRTLAKLLRHPCIQNFVDIHLVSHDETTVGAPRWTTSIDWAQQDPLRLQATMHETYPFNVMRNAAVEGALRLERWSGGFAQGTESSAEAATPESPAVVEQPFSVYPHMLLIDIDLRIIPTLESSHSTFKENFHRDIYQPRSQSQAPPHDLDAAKVGTSSVAESVTSAAELQRRTSRQRLTPQAAHHYFILPTVESAPPSASNIIKDPEDRQEIRLGVKQGVLRPFYVVPCPPCYGGVNLTFASERDPLASIGVYVAREHQAYEPFVVVPSLAVPSLPSYEERTIGRGNDKSSFFEQLDAFGWRPYLYSKYFLLNRGVGDEPSSKDLPRNEAGQLMLMTSVAWIDITNRIITRNVRYKLARLVGMHWYRIDEKNQPLQLQSQPHGPSTAAIKFQLLELITTESEKWSSWKFGSTFVCTSASRDILEPPASLNRLCNSSFIANEAGGDLNTASKGGTTERDHKWSHCQRKMSPERRQFHFHWPAANPAQNTAQLLDWAMDRHYQGAWRTRGTVSAMNACFGIDPVQVLQNLRRQVPSEATAEGAKGNQERHQANRRSRGNSRTVPPPTPSRSAPTGEGAAAPADLSLLSGEGHILQLAPCDDFCRMCVPSAGLGIEVLRWNFEEFFCARLGPEVCRGPIEQLASRLIELAESANKGFNHSSRSAGSGNAGSPSSSGTRERVPAPKHGSGANAQLKREEHQKLRLKLALAMTWQYQLYRCVLRDPTEDFCWQFGNHIATLQPCEVIGKEFFGFL